MASPKAAVEDRTIHISELGTPRMIDEKDTPSRSKTPHLSEVEYANDYDTKSLTVPLDQQIKRANSSIRTNYHKEEADLKIPLAKTINMVSR